MMQIEENGHQMGFLRKFMMENAGAAVTKRLVEKFVDVKSKNILGAGFRKITKKFWFLPGLEITAVTV